MTWFDRFKNLLSQEGGWKNKESMLEKQEGLPTDEKRMVVSNRKVLVGQLTPREKDLYLLLLEGFTLKEAAKKLSIKYSTANTHMTSIYKKLGVRSRAELIINYREFNGGNCDE